ncbi:IS630 family transposase [Shewanella inventionis]|uniref:IS630 family transposase n=1 Tax=Shewanella inventionis TaxID=1738770 RepID=UPI001CBC60B6|nr:IS630 family transposase [Shewanella inventionis]UAL41447.1 IS630 family transposase [Shewanella inventionis]
MKTLTYQEILNYAKQEKKANKRIRLLAVAMFMQINNRSEVARRLNVSRRSVNDWVSSFLNQGLAGLDDKPRIGKKSRLTTKQKEQVYLFVKDAAHSTKGGRLTARDIQEFITSQYDVSYSHSHVYWLLHKLGFSWITSRSKHPKQSDEAQETFKKTLQNKAIDILPVHVPFDRVDIWFQDEARFGQQNTTTRLWAPKGSRPRSVRQQQFEYAYLFGAICPATGATEALVTPFVNQDAMRQHLKQISEATANDRYALVILDGAGWHTQDVAAEFDNLWILKLPPYSPELNPIEQVWQWLRQHCLANRSFKDFNDIVEECCRAWNTFIECKDRVKRLCHRDWAKLGSL